MVVVGLVAVDFAMVEFPCAFGIIVEVPGTRLLTYESTGTELCRV